MALVPFTNRSGRSRIIASKIVHPGDTVWLPSSLVDSFLSEAAPDPIEPEAMPPAGVDAVAIASDSRRRR